MLDMVNSCRRQHRPHRNRRPVTRIAVSRARRGGSALVYITAAMVALLAFASLAVDLGHVYVVRSELQLAADAAARYGVTGLAAGVSTAQGYAVDAANDNKADGTTVTLNTATDVEFCNWDKATRTYSVLAGAARSGANALRVTARRTSTNGGAVQLLFARVIGVSSFDVQASSIAFVDYPTPSGIVGFSSITLNNNAFIAGYNSATDTNPTTSSATSAGNLSSNGAIFGGNNNTLNGSVTLGPSAPNVSGVNVSGSTNRLGANLTPPADAAWAPATNPGGVPQNYVASGNVTLPGGTYWFTSLNVYGSLSFSGPATLIVNGDVDVNGSLLAYNLIPGNLKINQIGTHVFGDDDGSGNNLNIVADISGPNSTFVANNNLEFRGRIVMKSITLKNNAEIYYDVALGGATGGGATIVTVR